MLCPAVSCCVLQPHGRDESLITRKMWKHILVQGLYQMFWLFFFMYAAPVLFEQYHITDNCTFIKAGPDENNPGVCGTGSALLIRNLPSPEWSLTVGFNFPRRICSRSLPPIWAWQLLGRVGLLACLGLRSHTHAVGLRLQTFCKQHLANGAHQ